MEARGRRKLTKYLGLRGEHTLPPRRAQTDGVICELCASPCVCVCVCVAYGRVLRHADQSNAGSGLGVIFPTPNPSAKPCPFVPPNPFGIVRYGDPPYGRLGCQIGLPPLTGEAFPFPAVLRREVEKVPPISMDFTASRSTSDSGHSILYTVAKRGKEKERGLSERKKDQDVL